MAVSERQGQRRRWGLAEGTGGDLRGPGGLWGRRPRPPGGGAPQPHVPLLPGNGARRLYVRRHGGLTAAWGPPGRGRRGLCSSFPPGAPRPAGSGEAGETAAGRPRAWDTAPPGGRCFCRTMGPPRPAPRGPALLPARLWRCGRAWGHKLSVVQRAASGRCFTGLGGQGGAPTSQQAGRWLTRDSWG